jgi:hypothetical protein
MGEIAPVYRAIGRSGLMVSELGIGARPEQLDENLEATQWRPTEQEVAALGAILPRDLSGGPGRVTGSVAPTGVAVQ